MAQLSATLADAFATDPILQWLAPSQRSDRRLRRLLAIELEYYVFPAGRVLTTGDFRGANLELPPGRWEMTVPLSAAIGFMRPFGLRLPRARRLQRLFEGIHLQDRTTTFATWVSPHASRVRALGRRCCAPRSTAATGRACPRISKPAPSAAQPCTAESDSSTSASCASRTDRGSGRCDGHRQRLRPRAHSLRAEWRERLVRRRNGHWAARTSSRRALRANHRGLR